MWKQIKQPRVEKKQTKNVRFLWMKSGAKWTTRKKRRNKLLLFQPKFNSEKIRLFDATGFHASFFNSLLFWRYLQLCARLSNCTRSYSSSSSSSSFFISSSAKLRFSIISSSPSIAVYLWWNLSTFSIVFTFHLLFLVGLCVHYFLICFKFNDIASFVQRVRWNRLGHSDGPAKKKRSFFECLRLYWARFRCILKTVNWVFVVFFWLGLVQIGTCMNSSLF